MGFKSYEYLLCFSLIGSQAWVKLTKQKTKHDKVTRSNWIWRSPRTRLNLKCKHISTYDQLMINLQERQGIIQDNPRTKELQYQYSCKKKNEQKNGVCSKAKHSSPAATFTSQNKTRVHDFFMWLPLPTASSKDFVAWKCPPAAAQSSGVKFCSWPRDNRHTTVLLCSSCWLSRTWILFQRGATKLQERSQNKVT